MEEHDAGPLCGERLEGVTDERGDDDDDAAHMEVIDDLGQDVCIFRVGNGAGTDRQAQFPGEQGGVANAGRLDQFQPEACRIAVAD